MQSVVKINAHTKKWCIISFSAENKNNDVWEESHLGTKHWLPVAHRDQVLPLSCLETGHNSFSNAYRWDLPNNRPKGRHGGVSFHWEKEKVQLLSKNKGNSFPCVSAKVFYKLLKKQALHILIGFLKLSWLIDSFLRYTFLFFFSDRVLLQCHQLGCGYFSTRKHIQTSSTPTCITWYFTELVKLVCLQNNLHTKRQILFSRTKLSYFDLILKCIFFAKICPSHFFYSTCCFIQMCYPPLPAQLDSVTLYIKDNAFIQDQEKKQESRTLPFDNFCSVRHHDPHW